jgi:hypothetical protein
MERVSESREVTEQAQSIFDKIAKDISLISAQIESISEATREQQFGIEQIAKAMSQMDQSTQTNNSAAHTAARLSDQLMGQSRKLTTIAGMVSELVLGVGVEKRALDKAAKALNDSLKPSSIKESKRTTTLPQEPSVAKSQTPQQTIASIAAKEQDLDRPNAAASNLDADDDSFQKIV